MRVMNEVSDEFPVDRPPVGISADCPSTERAPRGATSMSQGYG